MNSFALIRQSAAGDETDEILLYGCDKCKRVWSPTMFACGHEEALQAAHDIAERCCAPVLCDCGAVCDKPYTVCQVCRSRNARLKEQKQRDAAQKFTVSTAPPDAPVCWNDEDYAQDIDTMCEELSYKDLEREDFPVYVWICDLVQPQLDVESVIGNFAENLSIGETTSIDSVCNDLDELREFMETWNKKQEKKLWFSGDKQYIEVQYEDVYDEDKTTDAEVGGQPVDYSEKTPKIESASESTAEDQKDPEGPTKDS